MNDRFKFRAWDKEKDILWYDIENCYDDWDCQNFYDYVVKDRYVIEQSTGLRDKNGKLIYEGDWLKTKGGYYCYVVWFDGFWWVKSLPSEAMDLEHSEFYKECEVVGNIHENADLLGEE